MNNKIKTNIAYKVLEKQGIFKPHSDIIVDNAVKLFEHVPNPLNTKPSNVGLLVGKVQSGKTSVMIASSAVAFENVALPSVTTATFILFLQ